MSSPLQLEKYFFTEVSIQASPGAKASTLYEVETDLRTARQPEGKTVLQLTVNIRPKDAERPPYQGHVQIWGLFSWAGDSATPEEKRNAIVLVNGASILYGAIREVVANVTSRGPYPALMLPSHSFMDILEQKGEPRRSAQADKEPQMTAKGQTSPSAVERER